MLSKGIKKHISNPAIGLLPFILFVVLHAVGVLEQYALLSGLLLSVVGEFCLRLYHNSRGFSITFYISGVSILATLILWFFVHRYVERPNTYVVMCEVFIVMSFMILRASKTYIAARFFRQKNLLQKALMNEFYDSATLIQYGLTLHVFIILFYRQFSVSRLYAHKFDIIIFSVLPVIVILLIGAYQILKVSSLSSKLRKEEWLPIVTEKGEVTGKIAKNVSFNMKNKFLHPVVRVALVSNSKVYLQERSLDDILNPKKLDYPFEKYMLFNHEINLAARNSIKHMVGEDIDISINFLLKYVFENDNTRRLIFLFVANLEDEFKIRREGNMKGKFWTIKQLEDGFVDEIFSECFELEFEYLKNMVLAPSDAFGGIRASAN